MALAHPIKNTDKEYRCTSCSADNVSIIREDDTNPRLKCNVCNFMFNGLDSLAAIEAGAIKPSSAEALAEATDPVVEEIKTKISEAREAGTLIEDNYEPPGVKVLPQVRTPSHLFLSKPRGRMEICSKKDFKKVALRWSQNTKFDVYELKPISLNVKIDIS